jgi:hypothetical protein
MSAWTRATETEPIAVSRGEGETEEQWQFGSLAEAKLSER